MDHLPLLEIYLHPIYLVNLGHEHQRLKAKKKTKIAAATTSRQGLYPGPDLKPAASGLKLEDFFPVYF